MSELYIYRIFFITLISLCTILLGNIID